MDSDGFVIVSRQGKRRNNRVSNQNKVNNVSQPAAYSSFYNDVSKSPQNVKAEEKSSSVVIEKLNQAKQKLLGTPFYRDVLNQFKETLEEFQKDTNKQGEEDKVDVICYGIGNYSTSRISQFQIMLIYLIVSELKHVLNTKVKIFDPVFTQLEQSLVASFFGFEYIEKNENGERRIDCKTLFYMPHCDKILNQNVLITNRSRLSDIILVGNSLHSYRDRCVTKQQKEEAAVLLSILPSVKEASFPIFDLYDDIFNNTCFNTFLPSSADIIEK